LFLVVYLGLNYVDRATLFHLKVIKSLLIGEKHRSTVIPKIAQLAGN